MGWQSYEVVIDRPREPSSDLCIVVRHPIAVFRRLAAENERPSASGFGDPAFSVLPGFKLL
jgi:hypothetical protein